MWDFGSQRLSQHMHAKQEFSNYDQADVCVGVGVVVLVKAKF